jgi:tetratricopeptide (TPR) repeat protein
MRAGRLVATLAVAALLACAGRQHRLPGSERCPAHGGAPWREYTSRHFVVDTDVAGPAAAALVDDLERLRALVAAALVRDPPEIPGSVRVVVPASIHTYHALAPRMAAGYFGVTALGEPVVVLQAEILARDPEVIAHELAHHFTWYFFPRQPRWFAEGIAQFVQTVAAKEGPHRASAGAIPKQRADFLRRGAPMPAAEILEARRDDAEFELWSWVLYHWLWNHRSGELSEYERRLGRAEDPGAAWGAAFPEFAGPAGLAELTRALDAHRRRGEFASYPVHAQWNGAFTVAPLEAADVHMLLLGASAGRSAEAVRTEVLAALEDDAGHPVAVWRKATLDGTSAVPALRAIAAARPGDWRAWMLLAESLRDDARRGGASDGERRERIEAYRRALALNPSAARAHADLAAALAGAGALREALPHARRAVELWPSDARTLAILASVAGGLAACDEAAPAAARAVDLLRPDAAPEARAELAEIERRCGAAR